MTKLINDLSQALILAMNIKCMQCTLYCKQRSFLDLKKLDHKSNILFKVTRTFRTSNAIGIMLPKLKFLIRTSYLPL